MEHKILTAFIITFLAGLSTVIGGFLSFFIKRKNLSFLSIGLSFSAGLLIYIALVELLKDSSETLTKAIGSSMGDWVVIAAFFGGIALTGLMDYFLPGHVDEELVKHLEDCDCQKLKRVGIFTAAAISLHNLPEGLTTFIACLNDIHVGFAIAVAIAIHNISIGLAISLPIYHATGNKSQALLYSFLSGMVEPLGAVIGFMIFGYMFDGIAMGILYALIAGIMIYIAFDELLPTSHDYAKGHYEIIGVVAGMFVMALSFKLF